MSLSPKFWVSKSPAAQLGIKLLMQAGIQPHLIACRCPAQSPPVPWRRSPCSAMCLCTGFQHARSRVHLCDPDALRAEGLDREVLSILDLHGRVDVAAEDAARQSGRVMQSHRCSTRRVDPCWHFGQIRQPERRICVHRKEYRTRFDPPCGSSGT